VPRTSQEQFAHGTPVSMRALRPGDLIFSNWGSEQGAGHVSVYIGNGHIIEAAGQGIPVRVASINVLNGHILGARRYLAGAGQGLPNVSAFAHQQIQYHAQASAGRQPCRRGGRAPGDAAGPGLARQQPQSAQTAVQNLIASHQPQHPCDPERAPPQPSLVPTSSALASSLSALHTRLLDGAEEVPHTAEVVDGTPQGQGPAPMSWVEKSRNGVLLVLGVSMLVFETVGSLLGRPADTVIVGAALALVGLVPILQKEGTR
jgi:hypothetical protein